MTNFCERMLTIGMLAVLVGCAEDEGPIGACVIPPEATYDVSRDLVEGPCPEMADFDVSFDNGSCTEGGTRTTASQDACSVRVGSESVDGAYFTVDWDRDWSIGHGLYARDNCFYFLTFTRVR